ncbi:MAG: endonuclease III [Clostridia bacterium]|nr:endonuclease III [Clostridia bacterium]
MRYTLAYKTTIANQTWERLVKEYPDATCSLDIDEPYFFLIRAILSAQCTDVRVNATVNELKTLVSNADDVLKMGEDALAEIIKPCGLHKAKSKNIIKASELFCDKWNRTIPKDVNELMVCPGIGKKIANLLVGELYDIPALVVDTHFKRVSKRLGLTNSDDPLKVEADVTRLLTPEKWNKMGHLVVHFGRVCCSARNPNCDNCILGDICKEKNS